MIYLTGDTVFYDGVAEVARRFHPELVVIFAGAARTRGPFNLTMNTNDGARYRTGLCRCADSRDPRRGLGALHRELR
jgi:hypothetical protein